MTYAETLYDERSDCGDCYFWRHVVRRTPKSVIVSDYSNVQGSSDFDIHYPRSLEFDAAIDAWVERLKCDRLAWVEWSFAPVRDPFTGEATPFLGVAPRRILAREKGGAE